jgi:hypothetical protein
MSCYNNQFVPCCPPQPCFSNTVGPPGPILEYAEFYFTLNSATPAMEVAIGAAI